MKKISSIPFFLFVLIMIIACSKEEQAAQRMIDFSSPKSLFVDHITSHTGGVISSSSVIKVKLAKPAGDSLRGTIIEDDIFDISPSVNGTSSWEDNRTIVFRPESSLKGNQVYEVVVNLKKIVTNIKDDKNEFKFAFQTLKQNYDATIVGFQLYDKNKLDLVKVEGQLQMADLAPFEKVRKIITAKQSGQSLNISWEKTKNENMYHFLVENVSRGEDEKTITIFFDGSSIGVDKKEDLEISIPSLSEYKVISSRIVRGEENYISVLFSDPLNDEQNLKGLVTLSNSKSRLVKNLNELKIYPVNEISSRTTVTINKAVKNSAGYPLEDDYVQEFQFAQVKPMVSLIDKDTKAILPNSNGLVLPFEAVGLNAVQVTIVRIYEDNMIQYLQRNRIGGSNELQRVGKPVTKKTIQLNTSGVTDLNRSNRFTLNLEDIIEAEPGAVYQIRIGFKKRHSLYFCGGDQNIEEFVSNDEDSEWGAGAEQEDSYWDNYETYYNPDYQWEERDNPCSDSYYGERRTVKKILFASNLGIIAKRSEGGKIHAFVTNLLNTNPISNASLEVYNYQQQVIATGKTDNDGKTIIPVSETPFVIVAKKDDQIGYLKLDDGSSLSLSSFNVKGEKVQNGIKGFIYGERGVWRPADTLHLAFILEDATGNLPDNHPVIMELYNPANQLMKRKISSEPVGKIYRFDFATESEAKTGNWKAKAKIGGATFSKVIKIEAIKPNRLKINLDFGKEKFDSKDRYASGDLNVRWLSGAKAANLKAEFELMLSPVKTEFEKYPNFSFDDKSKNFYSRREMAYEGRVDANGYSKIQIDLGEPTNAPGALNAKLYGKVYEESGNFSISSLSIPYYPFSSFVGLKTPEGDKRNMLLTDQDHVVRIATVDSEGKPISRTNVQVELYKLNWKWWWDNSYDNISNYIGRSYRRAIQSEKINTVNGKGSWNLQVKYPDWGRYYVRVTDPVSGHSAGQVVFLDWPGWAGKGGRGELGGASMLDFGVEKDEYKVGDKIKLSIPSTYGNRILVSLETGSEVLQTFWIEADSGNTVVEFDATSDMSPNIYAHLTMIQPHAQDKNDLPIRLYGIQSIKIVDPETELSPVIKMPKELRPEQTFNIEIEESNKKPMAYTVALVDEGLLDITNFKTPEPWSKFYAREALGIKTWDIYDDVMGAFSGRMDNLLAVGGGDEGELKPKEQSEANRFKPVVKYLGPFYLKSGEKAKHTLTMPQYIGSVKTMVVAASDGAYGHVDKVTPVKQPLMVLATLPRVAGPGEKLKLPVNIFALDDNIKNVSVTVQATGKLNLIGGKSKTVTFSKAGDKVIYFDLQAPQTLGIGKVKVLAKSGSIEATYDIEMNIIPRNPVLTDIEDKFVQSNEKWEVEYTPLGIIGKNKGTLEISSLPPLNIEHRLGYLIRYPHGCIEQTTSSVFAQLFINNLVNISEEQLSNIQKNIDAGIKRLKTFQLPSGGFSYWPGQDDANNWGTCYAGHFLVEAKNLGYAVPEAMLSAWVSFQTKKAENWSSNLSSTGDNDVIQAYRLYTLAKAGNPSLGSMNRLKEYKNLKNEARWRLALAYVIMGFKEQANIIIAGLSTTSESKNYRYTYGSHTRDRAMILETLVGLEEKEKAFEIVMEISNEMSEKSKWMSTQTTAYSFIALSKFTKQFPVEDESRLNLEIAGKLTELSGANFVNTVSIDKADEKATIKLTNSSPIPVYVRIIRTGIPIESKEEPASRNIKFDVTYRSMDDKNLDITELKQGTNFKAEVTVTHPGIKSKYTDMALTQIFPSGWEIINTRLDGLSTEEEFVDYKDIRDDRVLQYFDLNKGKVATFTVLLNAAYQGKYYLPAASVEAMYDNSIYANQKGKWVEVLKGN